MKLLLDHLGKFADILQIFQLFGVPYAIDKRGLIRPDLFERSEALEAAINSRSKATAYLTSSRIPLRQLIRASDMLPGFGFENECEGVCDV